MRVNDGADLQARVMGGDTAGDTGTSTATGATSLTDSGKSWTVNAYKGHVVVTGAVQALVLSNTATILTLDQWSTPGTADATASTPSTGTYNIIRGGLPAWYAAVSNTTDSSTGGGGSGNAPQAADSSLRDEYSVVAGSPRPGLLRQRAVYSHSAGSTSYSLTATWTVNASDSGLPYTIHKIGWFTSYVYNVGQMLFEEVLTNPATLSVSGDQLTGSLTVSM